MYVCISYQQDAEHDALQVPAIEKKYLTNACMSKTFLNLGYCCMGRVGYSGGALRKRPTLPYPILAPHLKNRKRLTFKSQTPFVEVLVIFIGEKIAKLAPNLNLWRPTCLPIWGMALANFRELRAHQNPKRSIPLKILSPRLIGD